MITLDEVAEEQGTFGIEFTFTDSTPNNPNPITPNSINWSLYDEYGNVINDRSAVAVVGPASTTTIVLSGDDLQITSAPNWRRLVVQGTYDSDLGSNNPFAGQVRFLVENIVGVS